MVRSKKRLFDPEGVALLGCALELRLIGAVKWSESIARMRASPLYLALGDFSEISLASVQYEKKQLSVHRGVLDDLFFGHKGLDRDRISKLARSVKVNTFLFEWYHLYENRVLAPYLTDKLPGWGSLKETYNGDAPVSDHANTAPAAALTAVFRTEHQRLYLCDEPRSPYSDDEIFYAMTVSHLCAEPPPPGRPTGSGYLNDDAAIRRVIEIHQLESDGNLDVQPNVTGIVRRVISEYKIVGALQDGPGCLVGPKERALSRLRGKAYIVLNHPEGAK